MSFHKDLRGADLHAPTNELVENNTGSVITQLKCVSLSGMGAVYPQIVVANPLVSPVFGVVLGSPANNSTSIPSGSTGYVTAIGFMFNVNTSAFPVGEPLYCDSSGNLTTIMPSTPNISAVAITIKQDATYGVLYVFSVVELVLPPEDMTWLLTGNSGLDPVANFIGTTDSVPFNIRTDDVQRMIVTATGNVGIGTTTPSQLLSVAGTIQSLSGGFEFPDTTIQVTAAEDRFVADFTEVAATGRYLEIFADQSSDLNPFTILYRSNITALTLVAGTTSTGTVGIFKTSNLLTPIQTISLASQQVVTLTGLSVGLSVNDQLVIQVTSGSITRPSLTVDMLRT